MISFLDNPEGYIYAYIEWYTTDQEGHNQENGEFIYIEEIWIHPDKRKTTALNHLVYKVDKHPFTYKSKWVYWLNQKHNERLTRSFPRERLAKIGVRHG